MGADRGLLLSDKVFAGADTLATSYTLAKAIERIGKYDLVVTGQETTDSSTAHIGAQIAAWLKIPYIYYVVEADYSEARRSLRVKRALEDSYEVYELALPALVSVAARARNPRRVRLVHKLRAKLGEVLEVWSNDVLKLDSGRVGYTGSPTRVKRIVAIPEVPRKREKFEGGAREAAKWLVEKLAEDGLLGV
jgi:electron transfer flavoprotein beta subunit